MVRTAHGRRYIFGQNPPREAERERRARFRTITPDGRRVKLTMNVKGTFQEPMVVFTNETGKWLARTVVDKKNLPDWAKNYTLVEAVEI